MDAPEVATICTGEAREAVSRASRDDIGMEPIGPATPVSGDLGTIPSDSLLSQIISNPCNRTDILANLSHDLSSRCASPVKWL
jgi:hypothetical protein